MKQKQKETTLIAALQQSVGFPGGKYISPDYVVPNRDELMKAAGYKTAPEIINEMSKIVTKKD